MSDFSVRSDNVDVEQIMRQIRSRIREKRGVDYTEDEIRELANVKLEKFIDPKGVRSGLAAYFCADCWLLVEATTHDLGPAFASQRSFRRIEDD